MSEKLLDAKVRLHRRLIEEVNLSVLEKMSDDEVHRQIHGLVQQYTLAERLAQNAPAAMTTTISQGFDGNHTLCHGSMGNADILLHAAETLRRPHWRVSANQAAAIAIHQAVER